MTKVLFLFLFLVTTEYIVFAVDMMKPDTTVILRNAKVDMSRGSLRLAVDKCGSG